MRRNHCKAALKTKIDACNKDRLVKVLKFTFNITFLQQKFSITGYGKQISWYPTSFKSDIRLWKLDSVPNCKRHYLFTWSYKRKQPLPILLLFGSNFAVHLHVNGLSHFILIKVIITGSNWYIQILHRSVYVYVVKVNSCSQSKDAASNCCLVKSCQRQPSANHMCV